MEGTQTSEVERSPTFGEKAVGLSFNPSGDPHVQAVKSAYAQIIDLLNAILNQTDSNEKIRHLNLAMNDAETAQMRAVKAITWKD